MTGIRLSKGNGMRPSTALLMAVALCVPNFAHAEKSEQEQLIERMCREVGCQKNVHIVLKRKDGPKYDQTFPVFQPTVQSLGIAVFPGQTVNVEADIVDGRLANLRAVEVVADPSKTITASFKQTDSGSMMLHIQSPFEQILKFDMGIMPLDKDDLYKTSSCPVMKGATEIWPYPIFQVVLGNGRVIDAADPAAMVCQ